MNNGIYKKGLAVVLALSLLITASLIMKLSSLEKELEVSSFAEEPLESNEDSKADEKIVVDVDGAVQRPGVYELGKGARINDAIVIAGGLTEKADTKSINKAKILSDGEKIYIAEIGEEKVNAAEDFYDSQGRTNINTASKELLMKLDGIGETYAERIIEYREKSKFMSIEDIKNVKGIGEKIFEKIKDDITT
jgi:competence protein ComEA